MTRHACAALLALFSLVPAPASAQSHKVAEAAMPKDACTAMRRHMTEKPMASVPGASRPLSADSKHVLSELTRMGGNSGSAAPNAQAQAMLNMMATMMESRSDAESQASAKFLRSTGAKPGSNVAADMKALGC